MQDPVPDWQRNPLIVAGYLIVKQLEVFFYGYGYQAPGKHIAPHSGPYKGLFRYHLGLFILEPARARRIRVGYQSRFN